LVAVIFWQIDSTIKLAGAFLCSVFETELKTSFLNCGCWDFHSV